jgi:hypothetical protein
MIKAGEQIRTLRPGFLFRPRNCVSARCASLSEGMKKEDYLDVHSEGAWPQLLAFVGAHPATPGLNKRAPRPEQLTSSVFSLVPGPGHLSN